MSFPKANIRRFNDEVKSCAPPPGSYDPKYDTVVEKVKSSILKKTKQISTKLKNATSSESIESNGSSQNQKNYIFKTPQMLKKKQIQSKSAANSSSKSATTPTFKSTKLTSKRNLFNSAKDETLLNQINELTRVHSDQLLEKNKEISKLTTEIEDLQILKTKNQIEIEDLKNNVNECQVKHNEIAGDLRDEIEILNKNCDNYKSNIDELKLFISTNQTTMNEINLKYDFLQKDYLDIKQSYEDLLNKHQNTLEKHRTELISYKEAITLNSYILEREILAKDSENEISSLHSLCDIHQDINEISDIFFSKIVKLSECLNKISETINELQVDFDRKTSLLSDQFYYFYKYNEEIIENYLDSLSEYDTVKQFNIELIDSVNSLNTKIENLEENLMTERQKLKIYSVVNESNTKTIQALQERLFESEKNNEISELKILHFKEKFDESNDSLDEMQANIINDIQAAYSKIQEDLNSYKQTTTEEIQRLKLQLDEKEQAISLMYAEIAFYNSQIEESEEMTSKANEQINILKEEIVGLNKQIEINEDEFQDTINAQKLLNVELKRECDSLKFKCDEKLFRIKQKIDQLKDENLNLKVELENKSEIISEIQQNNDRLKNNYKKINDEYKTLQETNYEYERDVQVLAMDIEHFKECNRILKESSKDKDEVICQLEQRETDLESEVRDLKNEIYHNEASIQSYNDHVLSLMRDLFNRDKELDKIKKDFNDKNIVIDELSNNCEKTKALYDETKELNKNLKTDNQYVDGLVSDLCLEKERVSILEKQKSTLENEILILKDNLDKLTNYADKNTKLKTNNDLLEIQCRNKVLEAELIELRKQILNIQDSEKQKDLYKLCCEDLKEELYNLSKEIQEIAKERDDLNMENSERLSKLSTLEQDNTSLLKENDKLKIELSKMKRISMGNKENIGKNKLLMACPTTPNTPEKLISPLKDRNKN